MDFKQLIQSSQEKLTGLVNGESPKEVIDAVGEIKESLNSAMTEYQKQTDRLVEMTEAYVKAKGLEGSKEQVKEETEVEMKPKSLEEIAREIVNKEQK